MAKKKKKSKSKKKASKKTVRRRKPVRKARFSVPALSTLIKQPKSALRTAKDRIETAIEVKDAPGLFNAAGKRLKIGPKRRGGRRKTAQELPPEIAHIFE
jgi:hypothetical protein